MARRWLFSLAVAVSAAPAAWALDIGDRAPPIYVRQWVSSTPVSLETTRGKVLVVEFWATWCGPCRQTIPHLNRLHARLKDKGVVIVGVTGEDDMAAVRRFVQAMPMRYHVGLDLGGRTNAAYMKDVPGIPHAFVVDRTGKVAWQGHPLQGLDGVLRKLLAGTFDPAKVRRLAALRKQLEEAESLEQALAAVDAMLRAAPDDPEAYRIKRDLLAQQGELDQAHELLLAMARACADDPLVLVEVAIELCTTHDLKRRDPAQALQLAHQAVAVEESPETLDALARVHYELGHLARALQLANQAMLVAPEEEAQELKARAEFYRKEMARRRQDSEATF